MAETYSLRIRTYCEANGVEIPAGFQRRAANRYAAIDIGADPPRLIATTWFKQEDMIYYASRLAEGRTLKLMDFKERRQWQFTGGHASASEEPF